MVAARSREHPNTHHTPILVRYMQRQSTAYPLGSGHCKCPQRRHDDSACPAANTGVDITARWRDGTDMNYQDPKEKGVSKLNGVHQPGTLPDVFKLVEKSAAVLKGMRRRTVSQAGLTPSQYVVLGTLWARDGLPLKELAAAAYCTPATITGIVDVLERKGLTTRQANPADRRSLLVTLTPEGKALEADVPDLIEMFGDCCAGLSPDDTAQLASLLQKLNQAIASWETAQ